MVFLIDSDDDFREALAANFADDGHSVCQYARPADVPPLASFESLTVLILDYQMEGENGLSFADRFHRTHPDVPVVMLAVYCSDYLSTEVGARDFITLRRKPLDYEELASTLPPPPPKRHHDGH